MSFVKIMFWYLGSSPIHSSILTLMLTLIITTPPHHAAHDHPLYFHSGPILILITPLLIIITIVILIISLIFQPPSSQGLPGWSTILMTHHPSTNLASSPPGAYLGKQILF